MKPARWPSVAKLLDAALQMPETERAAFVRQAAAGDGELESEVTRLLQADAQAGSFLEKPLFSTLPGGPPAERVLPTLTTGTIVAGRFEIVRFIGQGGMGQVYEAHDLELKARIALKTIRSDIASDPNMLARFRREVQLTRLITHPNVCRTFDLERHSSEVGAGQEENITFLTMELLQGETLSAFLRSRGRLSCKEATPLVRQMVAALSAAHDAGIVHRDFKPSNIILVSSKSGARAVVTDFGLARAILTDNQFQAEQLFSSITERHGLTGTLAYMAPEQFERGEASVASDIYSLGLVMYEMVTGQRPFADPLPFAEAAKRLKQPAPSAKTTAPDLEPAWEDTIRRCLETDPKWRFVRVLEVEQAMGGHGPDAIASPISTGTFPPPAAKSKRKKVSPRLRWAISAILFLLVSLSVAAFRHYQVNGEARLAEGSMVLLTNVQNGTGDARFDGTTELIRHQLSQSPYFSLMDPSRIQSTLNTMQKPSAQLDPPMAREVAMRNGVRRVIFGVVSRVGNSYLLDLVIEQPDNDPLRFRRHWVSHWAWNMPSGSSSQDIPSAFLDAVRDSSDWIRQQIGESSNDIAREDTPPEDVTTAKWDALSEFAHAAKFEAAGQTESGIQALENAVAADPNFALGYARLGDELVSLSRFTEGYRAYDKALSLGQGRLTRRERDRIRGIYASDTWDFATAEAMFHDYATYYPHDFVGWFYRGTPLMMMGRVEEAIESLKKADEVAPGKMSAPAHIARFNLILGNYAEAEKWIRRLRDTGYPDDADLIEGEADFLQGRYQDSQDRFTRLKNSKDPLYVSYAYSLLTRLYAEQGKFDLALNEIEQGLADDRKTGDTVHQADKILDRASINCKIGKYDACLQDTMASLDMDRSLPRSQMAATMIGEAADKAAGVEKQRFVVELRSIEAHLPPVNFQPISDITRAHVHGEVLLAQGHWQKALEEFKKGDGQEGPQTDKRYVGRALLVVATHTRDGSEGARLKEARLAHSALVRNPGIVWQWAQDFLPGCLHTTVSSQQ